MSSGSFERLIYDECAYSENLKENDRSINYLLAVPQPCNPCRIAEPGINSPLISVSKDRTFVDVESDLLNIGRVYSKCQKNDYQPYCPQKAGNFDDGYPCGAGVIRGPQSCQPALNHLPECEFGQIESRTIAPPCTLRGIGIPRWDPLCIDPQDIDHVLFPAQSNGYTNGTDIRNAAKDRFKAMGPCWLKPSDQTAALPKASCNFSPSSIQEQQRVWNGTSQLLQPNRYTTPYPASYGQ